LVKDIINLIHNHEWYTTTFKIPSFKDFDSVIVGGCIANDYGIVFRKIRLLCIHLHQDKETIMKIYNKTTEDIKFFYIDDIYYTYTIDFKRSEIKHLSIIKQPYKIYKSNGDIYVSTIDPTFIVKYL
jgi:hypothetical protein